MLQISNYQDSAVVSSSATVPPSQPLHRVRAETIRDEILRLRRREVGEVPEKHTLVRVGLKMLDDAYLKIFVLEACLMGMRPLVIESELPGRLSRDKIVEIYKHARNCPPPRGMYPQHPAYFLRYLPYLYSSLFIGYYDRCASGLRIEKVLQSYCCYKGFCARTPLLQAEADRVLPITRAWYLAKIMEAEPPILRMTECTGCSGQFVVWPDEVPRFYQEYVCRVCRPSPRAGKRTNHASPS